MSVCVQIVIDTVNLCDLYRLRRWASACGKQPLGSSVMHPVPIPAMSTWLWRTPAGAMSSSCRRCTSPGNPLPSTVTGLYPYRKSFAFNSDGLVPLYETFSRTSFAFNNDRFVHTILFLTTIPRVHFHATDSLSLIKTPLARLQASSKMCCAAPLQLLILYLLSSALAVLCVVIAPSCV